MARKAIAAHLAAREFTREDWLAELAARYPSDQREPGDLTIKDMAQALNRSEYQARQIMCAEVEAGRGEMVRVRSRYGWMWVLRKKKPPAGG